MEHRLADYSVNPNYEAIRFFIRPNPYFLQCGDLYSNLNNKEKALKYYQLYHFSNYQINSKYCDKEVKLLSFRKISTYSLEDLINNEITVCSPTVMNDPFDSIALLWASQENLKRLGKGLRQKHEYFSESFKDFRIKSFSKNKITADKNILMWSHYADEHRGFCIEYTFLPQFFEQRDLMKCTFSVLRDISYDQNSDDILKHTSITTTQAFATKAKCWRYEGEVRLIHFNPHQKGDFEKLPLGNSYISAIYFGYRCSDDNIRLIKKY